MRAGLRRVTLSLLALGIVAPASAARSIRVLAPTRIDARATRNHGAMILQGQVRDDLAAPIAGVPLAILIERANDASFAPVAPASCGGSPATLDGKLIRTTSDEFGYFCVKLTLELATYSATISAAESMYLAEGNERLAIDLTRPSVLLRFDPEPANVMLDNSPARLELVATVEDDDITLPAQNVTVVLENEHGDNLDSVITDTAGHAQFHFDPVRAGPPGPGELKARFAGSASAAPSLRVAHVMREARVLLAPADLVRGGVPSEGIPIAIAVTTRFGPVASGGVEAKVGDLVVGAAPVRLGAAPLVVTFGEPKGRELPLRIRYVSDAPWLKPGDDLRIELPIESPSPWRQLPLVVVGGALATWLIASRVAQKRVRQPKEPASSRMGPAGVPGISVVSHAPRSNRGRLVGRVVDAHEGRPVQGARVSIEESRMQDTRVVVRTFTDDDGRFRLDASQTNGAMFLVAEGPLHGQVRQPLPQASEVEVALVLRRRRILDQLVRWARGRGGPFGRVAEPTPAEVREMAGDDAGVEAWASAIEQAAFDEADVDARVEQEIDRLLPPPQGGRVR